VVTQIQVPDNNYSAHPDPIANALDLTPNTAPLIVTKDSRIIEAVPVVSDSDQTTENDVKYARENLYHLAEKGKDALEELMELAAQSQHPRAYEVVGQLIKTLTDTNERIVDIQQKAKNILSDPKGPDKVTNNLFVGNTSELTKLLGGNARDVFKK
jgi:3-methyladenine DNA glycosylase/8-oxoguanine DNA glycosylase